MELSLKARSLTEKQRGQAYTSTQMALITLDNYTKEPSKAKENSTINTTAWFTRDNGKTINLMDKANSNILKLAHIKVNL
jgi:hypothetical protein